MPKTKEIKSIIDEYIDAPEGASPPQLHVLFDSRTRDYADQYHTALRVSRGLPFLPEEISITDPLVLVVINIFHLTDSNRALRMARQYYDKWNRDAKMHSFMLALLSDNTFFTEPTEWDTDNDIPPGIPYIPEPKYDLANQTEKRLKQIVDYLSINDEFQLSVMKRVNDAMVNLVNEVEKDTVTGFQSGAVSPDLHGEAVTPSPIIIDRPDNGVEAQGDDNGTGAVADDTNKSPKRKRREVSEV